MYQYHFPCKGNFKKIYGRTKEKTKNDQRQEFRWSNIQNVVALYDENENTQSIFYAVPLKAIEKKEITTITTWNGAASWSPDGSKIMLWEEEDSYTIRDIFTGKILRKWTFEIYKQFQYPFLWCPCSDKIAVGGLQDDYYVIKVDKDPEPETDGLGYQLKEKNGDVCKRIFRYCFLKWSHDGSVLAGISHQNTLLTWHAINGKLIEEIELFGGTVVKDNNPQEMFNYEDYEENPSSFQMCLCIEWSYGNQIACVFEDGLLVVHDIENPKLKYYNLNNVQSYPMHNVHLSWHPSNSLLAFSTKFAIKIFTMSSFSERQIEEIHDNRFSNFEEKQGVKFYEIEELKENGIKHARNGAWSSHGQFGYLSNSDDSFCYEVLPLDISSFYYQGMPLDILKKLKPRQKKRSHGET